MNIPEFDIKGQKALLVGAGRGIGKGIALAFAEAGAEVAVTGLTSTGVGKVVEEVRSMGGTALALTGDATKSGDMDRICQEVLAAFGQVDVLVNCVGDAIRKPVAKLPGGTLEGMTDEEWHHIIDINLTEAFQGCRALGPHLLERRQGCVINISGWASFRGRALSSAYDAAKTGLMRFTECLAQEWAPFGVRVNAIAPGAIDTPMTRSLPEGLLAPMVAMTPLRRLGRADEVAASALFLASDESSYMTGQCMSPNGGIVTV